MSSSGGEWCVMTVLLILAIGGLLLDFAEGRASGLTGRKRGYPVFLYDRGDEHGFTQFWRQPARGRHARDLPAETPAPLTTHLGREGSGTPSHNDSPQLKTGSTVHPPAKVKRQAPSPIYQYVPPPVPQLPSFDVSTDGLFKDLHNRIQVQQAAQEQRFQLLSQLQISSDERDRAMRELEEAKMELQEKQEILNHVAHLAEKHNSLGPQQVKEIVDIQKQLLDILKYLCDRKKLRDEAEVVKKRIPVVEKKIKNIDEAKRDALNAFELEREDRMRQEALMRHKQPASWLLANSSAKILEEEDKERKLMHYLKTLDFERTPLEKELAYLRQQQATLAEKRFSMFTKAKLRDMVARNSQQSSSINGDIQPTDLPGGTYQGISHVQNGAPSKGTTSGLPLMSAGQEALESKSYGNSPTGYTEGISLMSEGYQDKANPTIPNPTSMPIAAFQDEYQRTNKCLFKYPIPRLKDNLGSNLQQCPGNERSSAPDKRHEPQLNPQNQALSQIVGQSGPQHFMLQKASNQQVHQHPLPPSSAGALIPNRQQPQVEPNLDIFSNSQQQQAASSGSVNNQLLQAALNQGLLWGRPQQQQQQQAVPNSGLFSNTHPQLSSHIGGFMQNLQQQQPQALPSNGFNFNLPSVASMLENMMPKLELTGHHSPAAAGNMPQEQYHLPPAPMKNSQSEHMVNTNSQSIPNEHGIIFHPAPNSGANPRRTLNPDVNAQQTGGDPFFNQRELSQPQQVNNPQPMHLMPGGHHSSRGRRPSKAELEPNPLEDMANLLIKVNKDVIEYHPRRRRNADRCDLQALLMSATARRAGANHEKRRAHVDHEKELATAKERDPRKEKTMSVLKLIASCMQSLITPSDSTSAAHHLVKKEVMRAKKRSLPINTLS